MFHLAIIIMACLSVGATVARADTITAYCHCRQCTTGHGIAANGSRPIEGTTIAGPRWVPLGTRVVIRGVGTFIVQDRMPKRYEGRWDVYLKSHQRAKEFGIQSHQVWIVPNNIALAKER